MPARKRVLSLSLRNAFDSGRKQALKLIDGLQRLGNANDKLKAALPLRFEPADR